MYTVTKDQEDEDEHELMKKNSTRKHRQDMIQTEKKFKKHTFLLKVIHLLNSTCFLLTANPCSANTCILQSSQILGGTNNFNLFCN